MQITDPRGNAVERRSYNLRGQLTQTLDALGRATAYQYDAAGNLVKITNRKGQVTSISYDALNRPIETRDADGRISSKATRRANSKRALRVKSWGLLRWRPMKSGSCSRESMH